MPTIPILEYVTSDQFRMNIQPKRQPVILRGLDVGSCVEKWSAGYLAEKIGNKPVSIHVSKTGQMSFLKPKNFEYKTLSFDTLVKRSAAQECHQEFFLSSTEVYYLRSLGNDARGREVANFSQHYPEISSDFHTPSNFLDEETIFSSVLRVSSKNVQLWTHYDVMDNFLVQVRGRKRAVLFSPEDVTYLYLDGDKSRVVDIDQPDLTVYPEFNKATAFESVMEPGDILFIPALWFHNMTSLDFSVAVNVFWRNLQSEVYDKKDPYGNKDPLPASKVFPDLIGLFLLLDVNILYYAKGFANDRFSNEAIGPTARRIPTLLQEKNNFKHSKNVIMLSINVWRRLRNSYFSLLTFLRSKFIICVFFNQTLCFILQKTGMNC